MKSEIKDHGKASSNKAVARPAPHLVPQNSGSASRKPATQSAARGRWNSRDKAVQSYLDSDACMYGEPLPPGVRAALEAVLLRVPPSICDWTLGTVTDAKGHVRNDDPHEYHRLAFGFYQRVLWRFAPEEAEEVEDRGDKGVVILYGGIADLPHDRQVAVIAEALAYAYERYDETTGAAGDGCALDFDPDTVLAEWGFGGPTEVRLDG